MVKKIVGVGSIHKRAEGMARDKALEFRVNLFLAQVTAISCIRNKFRPIKGIKKHFKKTCADGLRHLPGMVKIFKTMQRAVQVKRDHPVSQQIMGKAQDKA